MVKKAGGAKLEFSFEIFQMHVIEYGNSYNLITQLISGAGGLLLIFSVVLYLDGFTVLWKYIEQQNRERKRHKEEEEQLNRDAKLKNGDGQEQNGKKKGKNDLDTQKSNDDLSEDDLGFMPGAGNDNAVHEGGRSSRPGSQENQIPVRRPNQINLDDD